MVSIIESNGGGQGGVISERSKHLVRFYAAMDELERRLGGARILGQCAGRMTWPPRGVYFVREPGELRFDGRSPRIVLLGTHAIKNPNEKSQLRGRIRTHRGNRDGGGNHRGSSFRLCVGQAILERDHHSCRSWAVGRMAATAARRFGVTSAEILRDERPIEEKVSAVICAMSILWLPIDDAPGPDSKRADIERNSTALLSNYNHQREPLDPQSKGWLGQHSPNERVCRSGLWSLGLRR